MAEIETGHHLTHQHTSGVCRNDPWLVAEIETLHVEPAQRLGVDVGMTRGSWLRLKPQLPVPSSGGFFSRNDPWLVAEIETLPVVFFTMKANSLSE